MDPTTTRKRPKNIVGDAKQGQKIMGTGLNGTPTPNPGLKKAQKSVNKPGQGSRGITDTGTRNEGAQTRPKTTVPKPGQNKGTTDTGTGNLNPQTGTSNTKQVLRKAFNEKKSTAKGKGFGTVASGGKTSNKKGSGTSKKVTSNKKKKKG